MVVVLIKWKQFRKTNYEVSNFGHVRNLTTGAYLILQKHYKGHLKAPLSINGKRKAFFVHRLVAICFIRRVKGKNLVNHKDTNKENNFYLNLEWCTVKENTQHAFDNGLIDMAYVRSCKKQKVA